MIQLKAKKVLLSITVFGHMMVLKLTVKDIVFQLEIDTLIKSQSIML